MLRCTGIPTGIGIGPTKTLAKLANAAAKKWQQHTGGVVHLGMSEREAWNATMTSLVAALRAKYPPMEKDSPGARAPTLEEHEATEAWFERVEAKRRKAAGQQGGPAGSSRTEPVPYSAY